MEQSGRLKLERARAHMAELESLLKKTPPFTYALETNFREGTRATFAQRNEDAARKVALICGDVVHNLNSALDHGYWGVVRPYATSERDRKRIQFPFCESKD